LGDAFTGFIERDAFAPIQGSQSVLDRLTELKFVNSVNQSCVGRKLLRHFQENLFRAHDPILYIIPDSPLTILCHPCSQFLPAMLPRPQRLRVAMRAGRTAMQAGVTFH